MAVGFGIRGSIMNIQQRKIGIEIENETESTSITTVNAFLQRLKPTMWVLDTNEGSLRAGDRGWEIKTVSPGKPYAEVISSLYTLYPILQTGTGSWRAAVHVHIDVNDMPLQQRAILLGLAFCADDSIFTKHAPARVESNFCRPLASKQAAVLSCITSLMSNNVPEWYGKYSSINCLPMDSYGTIEFRHLQTPPFGRTIDSVSDSLHIVENYVRDCAYVVGAVAGLSVEWNNQIGVSELQEAFLRAVVRLNASMTETVSPISQEKMRLVLGAMGKTDNSRPHRSEEGEDEERITFTISADELGVASAQEQQHGEVYEDDDDYQENAASHAVMEAATNRLGSRDRPTFVRQADGRIVFMNRGASTEFTTLNTPATMLEGDV